MSYYVYMECSNDGKIVQGKIRNINMGCIYSGVCSSLVALFLWQQVTHPATVMAHWGISPNR